MPSLEETRARLSYEVALYRQQLGLLQKEMEKVSMTTVELTNAEKAIASLSKKEALMPVGGGAFLRTSITQTNVIVPIGAQYLVEMDREDAKAEMLRRIEATKKAIEKLSAEFNKISNKLREVGPHLKKMEEHHQISERVDKEASDDYI